MTAYHRTDTDRTQLIVNTIGGHVSVETTLAIFDLVSAWRREDENRIDTSDHDAMVRKALDTPAVRTHIYAGKKVHAIKELRTVTKSTLLEAKNAIEDDRVWGTYAPPIRDEDY
jgi:ribosomal protein L7/L12